MKYRKIKTLLNKKNTHEIFHFLRNAKESERGVLFEYFLLELFKGNGWHVKQNGKKNDFGADLLLFKSALEQTPSFIVQAKNLSRALTYDQTKIELIKFEEKSSKKFKCNNFLVFTLNGFTKSALKLESLGVSLNDHKDIAKLIKTYSVENYLKKPSILLAPHNKKTYRKIKQLSKKKVSFAVIQATGTGKSYLISSQLNDLNKNKKALFVAPTHILIQKQSEKVSWLKNVEYKTYNQVMEEGQSGRLKDLYSLIILDELHRAGANEWQVGIQQLIELNKSAIISGYSATPIRYLDNCRNMSKELFGNNVVYGPDLMTSIATGILRKPKYITAVYQTEDSLSKQFKFNSDIIKGALANWCGHKAIETVLKDLNLSNGNKFIVFCDNEKKLSEIKIQLEYAIKKIAVKNDKEISVEIDQVTYKNSKRKNLEIIERFEQDSDSLKLLFSVNMLNEGIHVEKINGVFLFRKTSSPNIYFQQIGRALSSAAAINPIIIDFVQNSENLFDFNFEKEFSSSILKLNKIRKNHGFRKIELINSIFSRNYTREFFEIINKISDNANPWKVKYQQLKDFYLKNGHCNVAQRSSPLGKFVSRIRDDYKNGRLSQDKIGKLNEIHFNFNYLDSKWISSFHHCLKEADENGMLPINGFDSESKRFYDSMRRLNRKNAVPIEKRIVLDRHGFIWNSYDFAWSRNFLNALILKHDGDDLSTYCKKTSTIGKWIYKHKEELKNFNFKL